MVERNRDFLSEFLQAVSVRGRRLLGLGESDANALPAQSLAEALLSTRGEASGVVLAKSLLDRWLAMNENERESWFAMLARDFGPDTGALASAVADWTADPSPANACQLHAAAESRRQELFRRMNLAPGGTATLVKMREMLLTEVTTKLDLAPVDRDFEHLFASWFNRGFLTLKRIDWSTPADILEKIIRYEAVHEIRDWADLKGRIQPDDRRCFAFFHPSMPDEPLVFVEVALTKGIPSQIAPLIAHDRVPTPENDVDTAAFYSISNTQAGLRGISFGNFLIKQVVEELLRELPRLKSFVTLSPVPGLAAWLAKQRQEPMGNRVAPQLLDILDSPSWHESAETRELVQPALAQAAAVYLIESKNAAAKPSDAVARFHLNNGAQLERINCFGDLTLKGLRQSHGVMVNYLYDLNGIERNHELYANAGEIAASAVVKKLLASELPKSVMQALSARQKSIRNES